MGNRCQLCSRLQQRQSLQLCVVLDFPEPFTALLGHLWQWPSGRFSRFRRCTDGRVYGQQPGFWCRHAGFSGSVDESSDRVAGFGLANYRFFERNAVLANVGQQGGLVTACDGLSAHAVRASFGLFCTLLQRHLQFPQRFLCSAVGARRKFHDGYVGSFVFRVMDLIYTW